LFKSNKKQLAFCLRSDSIAMSIANQNGEIEYCDFITLQDNKLDDIQMTLKELVSRHQLLGYRCQWVLLPGQYQLLMTDALNIPLEEQAQALRWKMKGLIEYPVDDTAVDIFSIPPHGISGQRKKLFIVATQMSWLEKHVKLFEHSSLKVNKINIADLALRNLISAKEQEQGPFVFFYVESSACKVFIYFGRDLYLVRQLAININDTQEQVLESIILELQRSFDYCESELKLRAPIKLLLTPKVQLFKGLVERLKENISSPIESLNLNDFAISGTTFEPELQAQCLVTAGAVLENSLTQERQHATS
jgi:MSHA biogenesis protein MshI